MVLYTPSSTSTTSSSTSTCAAPHQHTPTHPASLPVCVHAYVRARACVWHPAYKRAKSIVIQTYTAAFCAFVRSRVRRSGVVARGCGISIYHSILVNISYTIYSMYSSTIHITDCALLGCIAGFCAKPSRSLWRRFDV